MKTTNRKIKAGKSIIAALLCTVTVFCSGCESTESKWKDVNGSDLDVIVTDPEEKAEKKLRKRSEEFADRLWNAAKDEDTAAFTGLFEDALGEPEYVNDYYKQMREHLVKYPQFSSTLIRLSDRSPLDNSQYYILFIIGWNVTGNGNNNQSSSWPLSQIVKVTDDDFCIARKSDVLKLCDDDGNIDLRYINGYPTEAVSALENGRFAKVFKVSDLSWMNSDITFTGTLISTLYVLWEEENGDICCLINLKNGFDQTKKINELTITLADAESGETLLVSKGNPDLVIEPNTAVNKSFTVSNNKNTDTRSWDKRTLEFRLNYKYD